MGKGYNGRRWVYLKCEMQPICSLIENKEKTMGCKWDTLTKHENRKIDVGLAKVLGEEGWDLHCKRVWPIEKHESAWPKGSQVSFDPNY
jgi:hypothetical protein